MSVSMIRCLAVATLLSSPFAYANGDVVIPAPRNVPYPAVIRLEVDATDVTHGVFRVRETLPVASAGTMTLYYPRWLPGNHSTTGPIEMLAGLVVSSDRGERLEWHRDPERMHAFHVDVPPGITSLLLEFQFVSPVTTDQGRRVMTPDLLGLQWEKTLLYPAGHHSRQITFEPSLRLPADWQFATALEGARRDGDVVRFAPVPLDRLVDSPLFAGSHYRRVELDTSPAAPVTLNIFADRAAELDARPEQIEAHRRVVREALALFGSRPFRRYDFLLAISSHFSSIGLEHHQSSENGVDLGYFLDWNGTAANRDLLPHELVHSWNGKFRRPADLSTPSYDVPMRTSLLWVYEGMTEYLGIVLAGRSGLWQPEFTREALAYYAASFDQGRPGRQWRNLQDTTNQPIISYRGVQSYPSWQRGRDYYTEAALLWLDVDTKIRELTRGRRSLDDFARAFFRVRDDTPGPVEYTFDDVIAGLEAVASYDWATLLRSRLEGRGPGAPLAGLERGGWRLAYAEEPSKYLKARDSANEQDSFLFSVGLAIARKSGKIAEVYWDSPAFAAGIAPDMTLIAVNGRAYTASILGEAIEAAHTDPLRKVELLVRQADTFRTVALDYHGGLRYPRLERITGTEDRLSAICKARAGANGPRPSRQVADQAAVDSAAR